MQDPPSRPPVFFMSAKVDLIRSWYSLPSGIRQVLSPVAAQAAS